MKHFTFHGFKRLLTMFVALTCITAINAQTWETVFSHSLSNNTGDMISEDFIEPDASGSWSMAESNLSETGETYSLQLGPVDGMETLSIKYDITEAGTYKFSFKHKMTDKEIYTAGLFYTIGDSFYMRNAVGDQDVPLTTEGSVIESPELELEPGTYWFSYLNTESGFGGAYIQFADFKLQKKVDGGSSEPAISYCEPTYTNDEGKYFETLSDTYVEKITLTNGDQSAEWNHTNREFYNVLDLKVDAAQGETVTAHLVGHSLGDYNESTVLQDLRFTAAVMAIDWNRDGEFEYVEKIAGNTPPTHNVGGNMDVLDITKEITVPADASLGLARVRINYTNAWFGDNNTAENFVCTCKEGIVYDFDINVTKGTPAPKYTVTWATPDNGTLTVMNNDVALNSGDSVEENTVLTITATPDEGYTLETLTVNGEPFTSGETYTVKSETTIAAAFETAGPKELELSWSKYGTKAWFGTLEIYVNDNKEVTDYGNGNGILNVMEGSTVKVVATIPAENGVAIVYVGGQQVELDENGSYTFTMSKETTSIEANFDLPKVNLTINKTGEGDVYVTVGNVTYGMSTQINKDAEFTVSASPAQGYKLESLEILIGGEPASGDTFTASADVVVNATFVEQQSTTKYKVTWDTPAYGTLSVMNGYAVVNSGDEVEENTVLTITAIPDSNYKIESLTVNGEDFTSGETYTVTSETTIAASFVRKTQYDFTYGITMGEDLASIKVYDKEGDAITNSSKVYEGTEYTVEVTANVENTNVTILVNGKAVDAETSGKVTTYTGVVNENTEITVEVSSGINAANVNGVYYNAEEKALYTDGSSRVMVYDLSGRAVLNVNPQHVVSVAELADGFYTAVVGDKVVKFHK